MAPLLATDSDITVAPAMPTSSAVAEPLQPPVERRWPLLSDAFVAVHTAAWVLSLPEHLARDLWRRAGRQPLWHNRTYLTLWGGTLVSATGSQMSQLAFPLLVLLLTHSATIAGLAGALRLVPYLVLTLPAGALVDRWNRRRVMLLCAAGRALAMGSIPVALALGRLSVLQILAVALVEGSLFVFFDLADVVCLPAVVAADQLPAASAQYYSLTDGITTLLGPALGGALFAAGRMLPFLVDAISYGAMIAALWRIRLPPQQAEAAHAGGQRWRVMRDDIGEGFVWLWRHSVLRALTLCLAASNLLMAGEGLLVIMLAQHLHASTVQVGLVMALGGGGTVAGAMVAEPIVRRFSFAQVFIGANWMAALLWFCYALAPNPFLLGLVMASVGATFAVLNTCQYSYRMALIPEAMQGRVSGIIRMLIYGALPAGLALVGPLIEHAGVTTTVFLLGVGLVALALGITLHPHIRTAPAAHDVRQETAVAQR